MKSYSVTSGELTLEVVAESPIEAAEEAYTMWHIEDVLPMTQCSTCIVTDTDTDVHIVIDMFVRYVPLFYGIEQQQTHR